MRDCVAVLNLNCLTKWFLFADVNMLKMLLRSHYPSHPHFSRNIIRNHTGLMLPIAKYGQLLSSRNGEASI